MTKRLWTADSVLEAVLEHYDEPDDFDDDVYHNLTFTVFSGTTTNVSSVIFTPRLTLTTLNLSTCNMDKHPETSPCLSPHLLVRRQPFLRHPFSAMT